MSDPNGADRITVTLISKVQNDLALLTRATGLSKTDVVNRAVSLMAFVELELQAGNRLLIHNPETKETERVHLL